MKNKINYLLVNLCLIFTIIFLIYKSKNLWIIIYSFLKKIFIPFIIAFFIAYFLNPILKFLIKKRIPKIISILFIFLIIIIIISIFIIFLFPLLFNQLVSFVNYLITFINYISNKYNFEFNYVKNYLYDFIKSISKYISFGIINIISSSINYFINTLVITILSIYFLNDMDKFKKMFSNKLLNFNYRNYEFFKEVDLELNKYIKAIFKIMIISFFEYSIIYKIIGHPNAFILGLLVSIFGIIPYVGGTITNFIAAVTALVVSKELFIRTVITFLILSIIDGYVINPIIYGKSNKIHPMIVIFACMLGSFLGGIVGMIIALPIAITIITFFKYFFKNKIL